MKLAVLILSYAAPNNVSLLADYFYGAADLYVHYDQTISDRPDIPQGPGLHVMAPARRIYWGGWSMVQAMLDLLRAAQHHSGPDRYLMISDDSAPLLPIDDMIKQLADPEDRIFAFPAVAEWVLARYNNFYHFDHEVSAVRIPLPEDRFLTIPYIDALIEAKELMQGRGKKPVTVMHGSQWWSLTAETVNRLLIQDRDDEWLRSSFRFSAVPDEMYIHTLVAKDSCDSFMFVDWTRPVRPWIFRSLDDIRSCNTDGHLFIRKVDSSVPELAQLIRTGYLQSRG